MDRENLRILTNAYFDVRLISLKDWPRASEFETRDPGGPFVIVQEGFAPDDVEAEPDEFVLARCGQWLPIAFFLGIPLEQRCADFVFGTMAELIELLESLPSKAAVMPLPNAGDSAQAAARLEDDLNRVVLNASRLPPERPTTRTE
jgi:hypothetical protein